MFNKNKLLMARVLCFLFVAGFALQSAAGSALTFTAEFQDDPAYVEFKQAKKLMYDEAYGDALKAFRQIVDKYRQSKYVDESHFWIAYSLEKDGQQEKAFEAYKQVVESYPNSAWANDARANMVKLAKNLYSRGHKKYGAYLRSSGDDPDEDVKLAALAALGQLDSEEALPILRDVLNSQNSSRKLREKAVFAVSQIGGPEARQILIELAKKDPHTEVREKAVFWLGQNGGAGTVDLLYDIFKTTQVRDVREKAIFSISQIGEAKSLEVLEKIARTDDDPEMQEKAVFWISQTGDERSLDILMDIFDTAENGEVREKIMFSVSQIGGPRAAEILAKAAKDDSDPNVQEKAIFWIGQGGGERNVDLLMDIFKTTQNRSAKEKVVFSISQLGGPRAREILTNIAKDDSQGEIQEKAIFWLGQHGEENLDVLLDIYKSVANIDAKKKVMFSISQINSPRAMAALENFAKNDPDPEIQKKAIFWLGQHGRESTGKLIGLYGDLSAYEAKKQVLFSVAQTGTDEGIDFLIEVAKDEDDLELRKKAIFWLGQSRNPRARSALLEIVNQ